MCISLIAELEFGRQEKILLTADGCNAQNKNSIMISMIAYWFAIFAPLHIEEVMIVYPVTGHNFIPPDRVFGRIERKLKKMRVNFESDRAIGYHSIKQI